MKKYLSLSIVLLMIISVLSGCSENGKAYIDIYKEVSTWETVEQNQEFNIKVALKKLVNVIKTEAKENNGKDLEENEKTKKLMDLLNKHSDLEINAKTISYSDASDYINSQVKVKMGIEIKFLGDTYSAKNIEFIMKDQKYYISNSYFEFFVDTAKKIANKIANEIGASDEERKEIDELDTIFNEVLDKNKEYFAINICENEEFKNQLDDLKMNSEEFNNIQKNITNLVFNLFKKLNVAMNIQKQGNKYSYEIKLSEFTDKIPTIISEIKLNEKDFMKSLLTELSKYEPYKISNEDIEKFDKEYESVLKDLDIENFLPLIEKYLEKFDNSYLKNSAELKNGVFNDDSSLALIYNDKELIKITSKQSAKKASKRNISVPADSKCKFLEDSPENMPIKGQIINSMELINSNPFSQFQNLAKQYTIIQNFDTKYEDTKAIREVNGIYQERTLLIDGKKYKLDAFNINGNTYYKLRDISAAFSEATDKFNVSWDAENKTIKIETGKAYVNVRKDSSKKVRKNMIGTPIQPNVVIDDEEVYFIDVYNFNGENYFQLRELGIELDFKVDYNNETKLISIDTSKPYFEDYDE